MKTKTVKKIFGTAIIALLCTSASYAQKSQNGQRKAPPTVDEIFEQMDKDEDGKLTKVEVKGYLQTNFTKIDTDENGFLTREEVENAPKPKGRPKR